MSYTPVNTHDRCHTHTDSQYERWDFHDLSRSSVWLSRSSWPKWMPHTAHQYLSIIDCSECHTQNFTTEVNVTYISSICVSYKSASDGKDILTRDSETHTHAHRGREETKAQHIDVNVNPISAWRWKCWCGCGNSKTCRCNTPGNCRPERYCRQMLLPKEGNCLRHCHSFLEQNYV